MSLPKEGERLAERHGFGAAEKQRMNPYLFRTALKSRNGRTLRTALKASRGWRPKYAPTIVTGHIDGIPVRPLVVGSVDDRISKADLRRLILGVHILLIVGLITGCSVWRLRTPEFNTSPQTNSVGEVWTPTKP